MISSGVSAPGATGLSEEAAGGLVVVAEGVRDDGGGQFEELLSDGGTAGGGDRDADLAQKRGQAVGASGLACSTAWEEPGDAWLVAVFMLSRSAM
ncbi:hypothetical protein ACFRFL_34515 [Streptomyces sp. NPDC056708]|uniref:hypothetical protein n=1 Tax=unclassified Streptomyces TaxID=2593676 RepID=UPI0036A1447C